MTKDDDKLLIMRKEERKLSWSQVESFFEGTTAGSLQVRYPTKLKHQVGKQLSPEQRQHVTVKQRQGPLSRPW